MARTGPESRRRRTPEDAAGEILDAAERLLRERSLSQLTVGELMARTGLGRSSFYVYFRDLHDLAARLLARLEEELWRPAAQWTAGHTRGRDGLEEALRGVVDVWVRHGPVLRAVVEASLSDERVARLWREELMERFVDAVAARIDAEVQAGGVAPLPTRETATALLLLNERYLMDRLGRIPQGDPVAVAAVLVAVWTRALYGPEVAGTRAPTQR